MKSIILSFLLGLVTISMMRAQEVRPFVINPIIGDTLDRQERDFYGILQTISGFQHAVFYLNADSSFRVVATILRGGSEQDTVIERYRSLAALREQIRYVGDLRRTEKEVPVKVVRVHLKNGSIIPGTILRDDSDTLIIYSDDLGEMRFAKANLLRIDYQIRDKDLELEDVWYDDPNVTRGFLMPTALTLKQGGGYLGTFELFFFTVALGLSDAVMVNFGILLLPIAIENQVVQAGLKIRLTPDDSEPAVAIGGQYFGNLGSEGMFAPYAVMTGSTKDTRFSIGGGLAMPIDGNDAEPIIVASFDGRVSKSVKFISEAWFPINGGWLPFMFGFRFFGSQISGDIGLMFPIGEEFLSPIGWPVGNFIYNF